MPDQNTARLGLPLLQPAQAQKHVTVNEALMRLDGLVNLGNDLHGELGWVLLALALGHVLMVIVHVVKGEAHIWHRMRG